MGPEKRKAVIRVEAVFAIDYMEKPVHELMRSSREVLRVGKDVGTGPGKYGRNRLGTRLAQDISNLGEMNFLL